MHREEDIDNLDGEKKNTNSMSISEYRRSTTSIIMQFIKDYKENSCEKCCNLKRTNNSFKEFPGFMYE